ncbi:MAG: NFACT family protein [Candidatus Anstonellaceae archaeon]
MKPLSMWEYSFILKEAQVLVGNYLKKIYQLDKSKFSFDFGKKSLIVNLGKNFYLASKNYEVRQEPSAFVMLLRKHLKSKKLLNISQIGNDRYYALDFEGGYRVILKQFAKGNLILLENDIVVAFFYNEEGIQKAKVFQVPPSEEPDKIFYFGKKYHFLEPQQIIEKNIDNFFVYDGEVYLVLAKDFDIQKAKSFPTFSQALEFLDIQLQQKDKEQNLVQLKKLEHRLSSQLHSLAAINKKIDYLKRTIDYIKQNIDLLNNKLEEAKSDGKKTLKLKIH